MSFHLEPQFTWIEVLGIVLLAALPMSQISSILTGVIKEKTGIVLHNVNGETTAKPKDTSEEENDRQA